MRTQILLLAFIGLVAIPAATAELPVKVPIVVNVSPGPHYESTLGVPGVLDVTARCTFSMSAVGCMAILCTEYDNPGYLPATANPDFYTVGAGVSVQQDPQTGKWGPYTGVFYNKYGNC